MATMRAICSLTAESRKHLNSLTLKLVGTTSSRMLSGDGRNSYIVCGARCGLASACGLSCRCAANRRSGSSVSTDDLLPGNAVELRVHDVEPIELAGDVLVEIAAGDHVDFVERRLVFEVRERDVGVMPRNLNAAMPRLPDDFQPAIGHRLLAARASGESRPAARCR